MTDKRSVMARRQAPWGKLVLVEFDEGIAWVTLNRPEKRNAMSPALNEEMNATLEALATDDRCRVLVLTGAGDAFTAGMDLKAFLKGEDISAMMTFIKNGSQMGKKYGMQGQGSGRMPGFGHLLTDEQVKAVVEYVRGL